MKRSMRLLLEGIKISLSSQMTYRADFILSSLISLAGDLVIPLVTFLIYQHGASFPGWSLYEVMLIQGLFMLTRAICSSFFRGILWHTHSAIREGSFDLLLLKPSNEILTIMVSSFYLDLGPLCGGIGLSVLAIVHLSGITLATAALCVLLCVISILLQFALIIIMASVLFKWVGNSRVSEVLESITRFGKYPLSLFSRPLRQLVTWVIPVTAIAYFPAAALLGRSLSGVLPAILASLLFLAFSLWLWRHMVKKYTSAGG